MGESNEDETIEDPDEILEPGLAVKIESAWEVWFALLSEGITCLGVITGQACAAGGGGGGGDRRVGGGVLWKKLISGKEVLVAFKLAGVLQF